MTKATLFSALVALAPLLIFADQNPKVLIKTERGQIAVEIYQDRAPVTAANFLKYVDAKLYDGSVFHRTVTLDNQPTNAVKIEVIQGGQLGPDKDFPAINSLISIGGPVRTDTIHYIHTLGHDIPDCEEVMEQVYWGGSLEAIKAGIGAGSIKEYQIRFFVGYSSWHPGQLAREIEENSWLVTNIDRLDVMHGSDIRLWEDILKKEDERYQMWTRYPEDPAWN